MLTVIACNQYVNPESKTYAQGPIAGVQAFGGPAISFYDPRTGEFWIYNEFRKGAFTVEYAGKVVKLGQEIPLSVQKER
jgi:hypothetical protein